MFSLEVGKSFHSNKNSKSCFVVVESSNFFLNIKPPLFRSMFSLYLGPSDPQDHHSFISHEAELNKFSKPMPDKLNTEAKSSRVPLKTAIGAILIES